MDLTLDQILSESEKDLSVDHLGDIGKQVAQQSNIFSKWLRITKKETLKLRALDIEMEALKAELWLYYTGKADPSVYRDHPMDTRFLKSESKEAINADPRYKKLNIKITVQSETVDTLEKILDRVKSRDFQLKNIIEWKRFESGV
jgi:hypothetical protein